MRRLDLVAIVASLAGHVALGSGLYYGLGSRFHTPSAVRTELLDTVELEVEEEDPEDLQYDPDEEIPDGQIVRAPDTGDSRRPDDARFVSDRNTRTKRETASSLRMIAAAEPARRASAPGAGGEERSDRPGGLPSPLEGVPGGSLERSEEGPRGVAPRGRPQPRQFEARPSIGALSSAIRGTGLDRFEDVPEGRETALNAVSWRHAPFFNRLARQVEQYWEPGKEFRLHDPTGHIYGFRDRETIVKVILNRDGSVRHLYVIHASGADFLDDEAVEAIDEAGPFPNPPRGLVDPHDDIIAFNFSFTVHVGEPPVVQVQRYPDGM
jgi:TonB family protein